MAGSRKIDHLPLSDVTGPSDSEANHFFKIKPNSNTILKNSYSTKRFILP